MPYLKTLPHFYEQPDEQPDERPDNTGIVVPAEGKKT